MNLAEQQEFQLWQRTELFLRACNEKLKEKLAETFVSEQLQSEIQALVTQNNMQIRSLVKSVYHFATTEAT